jgi:hypothetical protein
VGDLVLVQAFPNEPEAQVAAAALRDAGLHPVVLGHDPLAQLLDPGRGARVLVPDAEAALARERLGLGPLGERSAASGRGSFGARSAASGRGSFGALAGSIATVLFCTAAYLSPRLLPAIVLASAALWLWVLRARRAAEPE